MIRKDFTKITPRILKKKKKVLYPIKQSTMRNPSYNPYLSCLFELLL